jgi:hypothetical protein
MYIVEKYNLFVFTTETGRKTSVSFSCLFCSNKEYVYKQGIVYVKVEGGWCDPIHRCFDYKEMGRLDKFAL